MIKYYIEYQPMSKGAARPRDEGDSVAIEATDAGGLVVIPNVGDHVSISGKYGFRGRVRSRLFRYIRPTDQSRDNTTNCLVNIVVEETDDEVWGQLVKE